MLDFMRRKAQSTAIQVAILIIVLVFIFWGVGKSQRGGPDAVATVNGQRIPYQKFSRSYEQTLNRYREQFGGNLPAGLLEALNLKQQVLNQLVQQALLQQGGVNAGLLVGNDEVRKTIQTMEAFRQDGIFNMDRYKKLLASSRTNPADFEEGIRTDLLSDRILAHISRFATVPEDQLAERFAFENDRIKVEYVSFPADTFLEAVKVSDQALAAYYESHKQEYQSEPQIRLRYLAFRNDQAPEAAKITEQDVEQFYQMNKARFSTPEERHARHILIRSDAKESAETRAAKHKRLEEILAKAKAGADFAQLAKENSEDSSAASGGDLGYFSKGQMVQPFEDVTFSLNKGQISDILETRFGFHIIQLEDIRPAKTVPFAEVKSQIAEELKKQRGRDYTWKQANDAYEGIMLAGNLDKYATEAGKQPQETSFFTPTTPPAELADPNLVKTIFSLKKGELSSLLETRTGFVILYAEDVKEPQAPPLTEVRAKVEQAYRKEQSRGLAKQAATALLTAAKKQGASLADEAAKVHATVRESGFYSHRQQKESGLDKTLASAGLQLGKSAPWPETVSETGDGFHVLHFKELKSASAEELNQGKAALRAQMEQEEQRRILEEWLHSLQAKAEVTTNAQLLGTAK